GVRWDSGLDRVLLSGCNERTDRRKEERERRVRLNESRASGASGAPRWGVVLAPLAPARGAEVERMARVCVRLETVTNRVFRTSEPVEPSALFAYDGATNNLKLSDSGVGGVVELARKFQPNRSLYGLCRIGGQASGPPRVVMINWVGEAVDECRRSECASHVPAIKAFFKAVASCPPPAVRNDRAAHSRYVWPAVPPRGLVRFADAALRQ
ncbi:drebrin-like protein-like, partial [Scleropages formosus]